MSALASTLSSKGQITIPRDVRLRLGLREGDRVEFLVEGDRVSMRPARQAENHFKTFAGALQTFSGGVPEINAWIGEMRDADAPSV